MEFNESLIKGSVMRTLIKFAIPIMLANVLQIIYSSTDMYFLGNFAVKAEVSAATTGSMIMSLITLGLSGLTMGLMVMLGRHYGAKSSRDLAGAVGSGAVFFLLLAVALTIPFLLLNEQLIAIMKTPVEAVKAARGYLYICSGGIIFILGFAVVGHIFRGLGNSKVALVFAAISCVINIGLDLLFVVHMKLGAVGAAYATVTAQGVSLLLAVAYICRRGLGFPITRRDFAPRARYIRPLLKIGAPITLQEILVTISFMKIAEVVNQRGVDASAALGIVERLMVMFTLPTMAMASAVGAMAAQNIGSNQRKRAEKCMWSGSLISLCIALPICAYCVLLGGSKISPIALFSSDPEVIKTGALYIKSYVFDLAGLAFVFIFNAYFSACGYSVFAMAHSLIATFAVRVPIVVIMSRIASTTLFEIGLAAPSASFVSAVLCLAGFFWLKRRFDRAELARL